MICKFFYSYNLWLIESARAPLVSRSVLRLRQFPEIVSISICSFKEFKMKKSLVLAVLFAAVALVACGKKAEAPAPAPAPAAPAAAPAPAASDAAPAASAAK
jgi:hypothetical protein